MGVVGGGVGGGGGGGGGGLLDFRIKSSLAVYVTAFHHASLNPYPSWDLRLCMYFYYMIHCSMGLIKRGKENGVKREMKQRFEGK